MENKKKILFAVLNWGLGHATRSWELINNLINEGHEIILASDGAAKEFLELEFPNLKMVELPSYNAEYGKGEGMLAMLKNGLKTQSAVRKEKQWLEEFLSQNKIDKIISDNRYGIYHNEIHSVVITHQLNIKAPFGERIVNIQNHKWLNNFDEVWVPDEQGQLSGELSLPIPLKLQGKVKEIGWLSRFKNQTEEAEDIILAVVSGPEPQKSILVNKLKEILPSLNQKSLLYTGDPGEKSVEQKGSLTIKNHDSTEEFTKNIIRAKTVIGRSGYSSLMDCMVLGKKMVLIPTPGQDEQKYLAAFLKNHQNVNIILQKDLNRELLKSALTSD